MQAAIAAGDALVEELAGTHLTKHSSAPTMGNLKKLSYTHTAMVDLIIEHPEMDQNAIAAYWGYTPAWISNILASDAFQNQLEARRQEVIDPVLKATLKERFQALTIQSLNRLQEELAKPACSPNVMLKAAELGAKSLGLGGHAVTPPQESSADRLERLAHRLIALQPSQQPRLVEGEIVGTQAVST